MEQTEVEFQRYARICLFAEMAKKGEPEESNRVTWYFGKLLLWISARDVSCLGTPFDLLENYRRDGGTENY